MSTTINPVTNPHFPAHARAEAAPLPLPLTRKPIWNFDGTPDRRYALRLLKAYADNAECRWVIGEPSPLLEAMNRAAETRTALLHGAIAALEDAAYARPMGEGFVASPELARHPRALRESVLTPAAYPDARYPLRVLKLHREQCDARWEGRSSGHPSASLAEELNGLFAARARELDWAIEVLTHVSIKADCHGALVLVD